MKWARQECHRCLRSIYLPVYIEVMLIQNEKTTVQDQTLARLFCLWVFCVSVGATEGAVDGPAGGLDSGGRLGIEGVGAQQAQHQIALHGDHRV